MKDYVDVATRVAIFRESHPEGSLQAEIIPSPMPGFIAVRATAYRTPDDTRPGIGHAWEPFPGKTQFTKDSELQNAETSAWGRAIVAALAADTRKGGIASAEEVHNRAVALSQGQRERDLSGGSGSFSPPPDPDPGDLPTAMGSPPGSDLSGERREPSPGEGVGRPSAEGSTAPAPPPDYIAPPPEGHVHEWKQSPRVSTFEVCADWPSCTATRRKATIS